MSRPEAQPDACDIVFIYSHQPDLCLSISSHKTLALLSPAHFGLLTTNPQEKERCQRAASLRHGFTANHAHWLFGSHQSSNSLLSALFFATSDHNLAQAALP